MKDKRLFWQRAAAVAFALLLWQVAAMRLNQRLLLVSPAAVLLRLAQIVFESGFWATVAYSAARIIGGFMLAFALGIALAVLAGRLRPVETFLWPYVITIKTVPVASFIILSIAWLGSERLSVFISFLMVFPIIYSNVLQGIKSSDKKLLEMARLYRMGWGRRLLYIHLPQVRPFLVSACSVALGMSWKAGVTAEIIGVPDGSIGEMLYESKIYYDIPDLFAWTVVIVAVSVAFEKLFLLLLKKAFAGMEKL